MNWAGVLFPKFHSKRSRSPIWDSSWNQVGRGSQEVPQDAVNGSSVGSVRIFSPSPWGKVRLLLHRGWDIFRLQQARSCSQNVQLTLIAWANLESSGEAFALLSVYGAAASSTVIWLEAMPYCLIANQIIKTVFVAYEASKVTATVTSAASSVTITILYLSS